MSQNKNVLIEKLKSRDLNIAHLDKLVDKLEDEIDELDTDLSNSLLVIHELKKKNKSLIKERDELESHNRVLTNILTKVVESIPAEELSRRMYGFISDDEGNIREVTS